MSFLRPIELSAYLATRTSNGHLKLHTPETSLQILAPNLLLSQFSPFWLIESILPVTQAKKHVLLLEHSLFYSNQSRNHLVSSFKIHPKYDQFPSLSMWQVGLSNHHLGYGSNLAGLCQPSQPRLSLDLTDQSW